MPTYAEPAVAASSTVTTPRIINPRVSVATSGTPTFDASTGSYFIMTATANVTAMTITNPTIDQVITIDILQDGSGGWTLTWPTNLKGGTGVTTGTTVADTLPTGVSATASKHTTVTARYDGTNWIEQARSVNAG